MTAAGGNSKLSVYAELFKGSRLRSLDARELLLHAGRFERIEGEYRAEFGSQYRQKKIAVLASGSVQHLLGVLRLFLYGAGIAPTYYIGPYDGVLAEGLEPASGLYEFAPEILVIFPAIDDIKSFPPLFSGEETLRQWVESQAEAYLQVWRAVGRSAPGCLIVHALFVLPLVRQLGNLESSHLSSRTNCIRALNAFLVRQRPANATLIDMDYFAGLFGKANWFDEVGFFVSKQPFSLKAAGPVSAFLGRLIATASGDVKKCLVLDLDNTLWGGVVGDDGPGGINIDPNNPAGEAHLAFQRYLRALKERGVMLAVCSKNDELTAKAPFLDCPDMLLKLDDFAAFVANWDDKISNLRLIARQLNIGLDAMVFFDDNPSERMLVEQYEPAVHVIDVPEDPALFVRALDSSFCFEWLHLTREDTVRVDSHVQDEKRRELERRFENYDAYLGSLEMEGWIEHTDAQSLPRACQLINKTNQFNLRTRRYTEAALAALRGNPEFALMQVRLKDKFTNYGIIASAVIQFKGDSAFIDNWVMSCRAFKRGVEDATMNAIVALAGQRGCTWVYGMYTPSAKNSYVASLFVQFGFAAISDGSRPGGLPPNEGKLYRIALAQFTKRAHAIHVHEELVR